MSGRDLIPHHIREARQHIDDDRIRQSVAAFDAMARSQYKGARSRTGVSDLIEHVRPEGETWHQSTPEEVRARLVRDAVIPGALAVPCPEHDAVAGAHCFRTARGVCKNRLRRAA